MRFIVKVQNITFQVNGFIPPENKEYTPLSKLGGMEALAQVHQIFSYLIEFFLIFL